MQHGSDSSPRQTTRLVLAEQIRVCELILEATETASRALDTSDLVAFEGAIRTRELAMDELTRLAQALGPDRADPSPDQELRTEVDRLQDLVRRIEEADEAARRKSTSLADSIRKQLAGLTSSRRVLRGYRGTGQSAPRFTDRKG